MTRSVQTALQSFMEMNEAMNKAVEELRRVAKVESAKRMQAYIAEENFEAASDILAELSEFTKVTFESNADALYQSAEKLVGDQVQDLVENESTEEAEQDTPLPETVAMHVTVVREENALTEEESELLELVGTEGLSREKDAPEPISSETLNSLADKGYLEFTAIREGQVFQLTEQGEELFESLFGQEAKESLQSSVLGRYKDLEKGFFLHDIEEAFRLRNYTVIESSVHQVEITKDNRHSYLSLDLGNFGDADYMKILNRKNQLKNIGFVCVDKRALKKAKLATQRWSAQHKEKCKFLSVHFTTLDKIENSPQVFETLSF